MDETDEPCYPQSNSNQDDDSLIGLFREETESTNILVPRDLFSGIPESGSKCTTSSLWTQRCPHAMHAYTALPPACYRILAQKFSDLFLLSRSTRKRRSFYLSNLYTWYHSMPRHLHILYFQNTSAFRQPANQFSISLFAILNLNIVYLIESSV